MKSPEKFILARGFVRLRPLNCTQNHWCHMVFGQYTCRCYKALAHEFSWECRSSLSNCTQVTVTRKVRDVYPICIVISWGPLLKAICDDIWFAAFLGGHAWVEERLVLWVSSEQTQSLRLSPEKLLDQKRVGLDGLSPELDHETLNMCTATQRAGGNRMKLKWHIDLHFDSVP